MDFAQTTSRKNSWQVVSLRCNGAFSLCDRDGENGWAREVRSCFECMHEQAALAGWAGIPGHDLSAHLTPDDIIESKRWMLSIETDNLESAVFRDMEVYPLCRGSLRERFGTEQPDLRNRNHEFVVRRIMLSAVRMLMAAESCNRRLMPEFSLVSGGDDFMTASYLRRAREQGVKTAVFRWDLAARSIKVSHPVSSREYSCPLVFEDITGMRADSRTWPWEITQIMDELFAFLEITSNQLELPIAR